jgi:hypothetical protein
MTTSLTFLAGSNKYRCRGAWKNQVRVRTKHNPPSQTVANGVAAACFIGLDPLPTSPFPSAEPAMLIVSSARSSCMDVEKIKANVRDAYESFSSYEDSGSIKSTYFLPEENGWFKTFYRKPNQVRLEWSPSGSEDGKCILIVNGGKAQLLMSEELLAAGNKNGKRTRETQDIQKVMPVNLPMSGAGGITFGMTDTILTLLVTESGRPCFVYNKIALLREEVVNEEPCYVLREIFAPTKIWISQNDFTVRRCESGGHPLIDWVARGVMSSLTSITKRLNPRSVPEKSALNFETTRIWTFGSIRYNHAEHDFSDFAFHS